MIVGASLAGAKAAEELRERGFDGRVVLIGTEDELPYERPPLSKDYLRGESERDAMQVHDRGLLPGSGDRPAARHDRDRDRPGRRQRRARRRRGRVRFDALLLTTGSSPRRLELPGAELDGIHYLRTIADSDAIRARIEQGGHVAVVGGGWIGSEIAASARQRGLDVTVIDSAPLPMAALGPELGQFYRDVHAGQGVEFVLGTARPRSRATARCSGVRTESGRVVECDFVVVGAGATPNVELGQRAGLDTDNGILADPRLADVCSERVRGRRHRQPLAPVLRASRARRALGQCAEPGAGRRAVDAR